MVTSKQPAVHSYQRHKSIKVSSVCSSIMTQSMEDAARKCVTYARQLSTAGCYSKSFDFYIAAFEKCSRIKSLYESEFRLVLARLNEILTTAGKIENIFSNFECAAKVFPNNFHLLNEIAKYLYKFGFYSEAWCYFQKALKINPRFVNAEKNFNSVKNLLVERWHFRMLNDKIRNEAYHEAILRAIVPNVDSVLDVGTGTGILAIYASECTPVAITACDSSEVMAQLAECIIQENNIQKVRVFNKMSTDMKLTDIHLKPSILLTELFDAGLFGEHVLQMLAHAWDNLISSSARVVPNKGEFFVVGVNSDYLNRKYQLNISAKQILGIPSMNVHVLTNGETYDCEDVHLFKDIKYMTEPQSVLKIDFNNRFDIQEKLQRTNPYNVELKAKESGLINNMIGWFNLYLTDTITITTDPHSNRRSNAWQQAVFFDNIPKTVVVDENISLKFLINGGKLSLEPNDTSYITRISPETIRFLNDTEFIKMIQGCIGMVSVYLGQLTDMSQMSILDLCPFPLFGLLMLQRGARSLICSPKTDSDKKFFKTVFKANKIPRSKITFLVGDSWTSNVFGDEQFHAIFCNVFELCGDIDMRQNEISQHLKQSHLLQGGLFMPNKISIVGQLVSSNWLDINNKLYDENVSNYQIANFVNMYQVSQNFHLELTNLEYTALSEPNILGIYNNMTSEIVNVPIVNSGKANAMLCWYDIEILEEMGEISTNRSNCFIDGMAFLASTSLSMVRGLTANILICVDVDGAFKLMIDSESR